MKSVINQSLQVRLWTKFSRDALKWSIIHATILGILVYDVSKKCKYASKWFWVEYVAIGIITCSLLYCIGRYLYFSAIWEPVVGTAEQKQLLQFDEKDTSFVVRKKVSPKPQSDRISTNTTLNYSNLSCSFNESYNISGYSTPGQNQSIHNNRSLNLSSANNTKPQSTFSSPYLAANTDMELFLEPAALNSLLKDATYQDLHEEEVATAATGLNTFWGLKIDDFAGLLKTSKYQMSPTTTITKQSNAMDECGFFVSAPGTKTISDTILDSSRLSSAKLSHCVTNLKRWISATILERVVQEISKVDGLFKSKGFTDMEIGHVALDRLKKTAENHLVTKNIPTLPLLIPYLELTANQEYLVNRIKSLAKGSCLAEFRHAATQNCAVPWDEHLPTDAAVIFHLFCTYIDMQLLPLPQPGGRPFYDRYVLISDKKSHSELIGEVKNKAKCAILVSNPLKPTLHFVSPSKINESVPDRNNLFHVIAQFIYHIKTEHGGYLENVNLDKSGLNLLCILDD